jgi:hypothetical protein
LALHIWKPNRIRSISHVFLYLITKKARLPRPDSAYCRQSPIIQADAHGPTIVQWNQRRFTRRSGDGKYDNAIWYSRPIGKSEDGAEYARLITFKDLDEVEPLNPAVKAIHDPPPQAERSISHKPASGSNGKLSEASAKIPNPHLIYGDKSEVPDNPETIAAFNAFIAKHQRKPTDRDELRNWYQNEYKTS